MKYYVNITQGQVHYQREGSGEPLLLLHQTRMSSEEYSEMIPILAKTHQVVAMDLLGHGNSVTPPSDYTIEDHAKAITYFLDALGVEKTSIVGHHVGARIAVELAANWPERVNKLILSGCPWYTEEQRRALEGDWKYHRWKITEDNSFLVGLGEANKRLWGPNIDAKALCKILGISLQNLSSSYNIHEAVFKHDIDPRLRMVGCPTLLLSGSEDVFYDKLEPISRLIPRSRTQVIDGAGGYICLQKPKEFAEAIVDFLKDPEFEVIP